LVKVLRSLLCGLVGLVSATAIAGPLPAAPKVAPKKFILAQNFPQTPYRPGVYQAAPYTGVVLVPPEMDSKSVIWNRGTKPYMPMAKPELRLIPREYNNRSK